MGLGPGIFVENDDRIFIASRGEIPIPSPLPADFAGYFGSIGRSALNAPENEVHGCLRVVDSNGKVLELWSQWDKLFEGTNGPHKIRISPYDPQHRVWVVGETKNVIYVFSNDGTQLLQTLGVEGVAADDETHFGKPQDVAFLPDGSVLVADGLTNARIVKLDKNGKFVMAWGSHGAGEGQFSAVHGVDVDRKGHVYVADSIEQARAGLRRDRQVPPAVAEHPLSEPCLCQRRDAGRVGGGQHDGGSAEGRHRRAPPLLVERKWPGSGWLRRVARVLGRFQGNVYTADNVLGRPQKLVPKPGADPRHLIGPAVKLMPKAK